MTGIFSRRLPPPLRFFLCRCSEVPETVDGLAESDEVTSGPVSRWSRGEASSEVMAHAGAMSWLGD